VRHGHSAIGIDGDVQGFMHQEVVSRTLTDDSKVVYKRVAELAILERTLKALLRNPSRLVLVTGGFARTRKTLG
jgi:RNase P/RNase MRP subunit p29